MESPLTSFRHANHFTSVVRLPIWGLKGTYTYYRFNIAVCGGSQTRTFLLSYGLSSRLWKRYISRAMESGSCIKSSLVLATAAPAASQELLFGMPGEGCSAFLLAVKDALIRKHTQNEILTTWIASSSLYRL